MNHWRVSVRSGVDGPVGVGEHPRTGMTHFPGGHSVLGASVCTWVESHTKFVEWLALGLNREAILFSSIGIAVFVTMSVFLISRFGLLSYMSAIFVWYAFNDLPLSLDTSAWFAGRSLVAAAILLGVGIWSFHASLGRGPARGAVFD